MAGHRGGKGVLKVDGVMDCRDAYRKACPQQMLPYSRDEDGAATVVEGTEDMGISTGSL